LRTQGAILLDLRLRQFVHSYSQASRQSQIVAAVGGWDWLDIHDVVQAKAIGIDDGQKETSFDKHFYSETVYVQRREKTEKYKGVLFWQ
jgi:hypothetical protein